MLEVVSLPGCRPGPHYYTQEAGSDYCLSFLSLPFLIAMVTLVHRHKFVVVASDDPPATTASTACVRRP